MDWKTIGTFAAVFAAILTIAFNSVVQLLQLRRDRRIALRKSLYSLIEVWLALSYVKSIKKTSQIIERRNVDKGEYGYDFYLNECKNLKDKHSDAVEMLSSEFPSRAVIVHRHAMYLELIEDYISTLLSKSEAIILVKDKLWNVADVRNSIGELIENALNDVESDIRSLSHLCGRETDRETKELLETESKKWLKISLSDDQTKNLRKLGTENSAESS